MFDRLDHLGHHRLCLLIAHVQSEATDLRRNVLDPIATGPVQHPRLAVAAGQRVRRIQRGPQRGGNDLAAQGLCPLRMPAFRSSMTAGQRGDGLYQLAVRSIVIIIVVIATRTAVPTALFLLLLDGATTVTTLMNRC